MPKLYGYTEIIGDMLITGSFSILGSASTINTTNLLVSDPILVLAHGQTGSPILDSGFFVDRGASATVGFIWDESVDQFALIQTSDNHESIGNVNITSYSDLRLGNIGIGGAIPTNTNAYIKGIGSTSSTYALNIENSLSANLLSIRNDSTIYIGGLITPTYPDNNVANYIQGGTWHKGGLYLGSDIENHTGGSIADGQLRLGKNGEIDFYADYGGPGQYNYGGLIYSNYTSGLLSIRGGVGGLSLLGGFTSTVGLNVDTAGYVGVGSVADGVTSLYVKGVNNTSSNFGIKIESASASSLLSVRNDGLVSVGKTLQVQRYNYNSTKAFWIEANSIDDTEMSTQNADLIFKSRYSGVPVESLRLTKEGVIKVADFNYLSLGALNSTTDKYGYLTSANNTTIGVGLKFEVCQTLSNSGFVVMTLDTIGNVGIGLTGPTSRLHVKGIDSTSSNYSFKIESASASSLFNVRNDGNVGIGTSIPTAMLHIDNLNANAVDILNIRTNFFNHSNFRIQDVGSSAGVKITSDFGYWGLGCDPDLSTVRLNIKGPGSSTSTWSMSVRNQSDVYSLVIKDDGNIGIGTISPTTKLHINATASGAGFRLVDTTEGAGKVLTSDVNGVATWQPGSSLCEFYSDGSSVGTTLTVLYTTSGLIDTSNLLAKNGDKVKGVFSGYFTGATASTKSVHLYFGGNDLFGSSALAYNSPSYWRVEFCIIRSNSSQIRQDITFSIYDSVTNLSHIEQSSGAYGVFDFTTDEVIEILGQSVGGGSADGDIISRAGYIEYTPSK